MKKLIGKNSIYFIGKLKDIKLHLASLENKNTTLSEYIKQQYTLYKNSLN